MRGFKIAPWAETPADIENSAGNPLFKTAELNWSRPTIWPKDQDHPSYEEEKPFLYALVRNHGNSQSKDHIEYIGLTTSPKSRFENHKTARSIVAKRGSVKFSYAPIDFVRGRNRIDNTKRALEEIEHILIWVFSDGLHNERKQFTLPGMGTRPGNAWHIINKGYRFSGRMPREIVFPWMIIKPGRDRTQRLVKP